MAQVYMVTGKLGGGKSLGCVSKIRDYLNQGRPVATNLDLYLEKLVNPWAKNIRATRLPDKPKLADLENLPNPYEGKYDESKTGLIVLDECGTWFNTRDYRDKARQPLINKLLHIRKAGWDVMFIIQHIDMIDKQVREGLGEHVVTCQRADRLGIPFITPIFKLFGITMRPPKIHLAIVRYGTSSRSPLVDRWVYNGADLYNGYDTRQIFGANDAEMFSYLPPYTIFGQYKAKSDYVKEQAIKARGKIFAFLKGAKRTFFLIGLAVGSMYSLYNDKKAIASNDKPLTKLTKAEKTTQSENNLYSVRITASVRTTSQMEYYFWDDSINDYYYPNQDGFKIRAIDECKARLINMNSSHVITCNSGHAAPVGDPQKQHGGADIKGI